MLFNSVEFLFFFLITTTLFFLFPHRLRWTLLLFASCFFYMFFKPVYIFILGFTIVIDYCAGILLERTMDEKRKSQFLLISLIANIGVLAIFKYYNFINDQVTGIASELGFANHIPYLSILLPIGLSFHTFQAMSYTIEVYRGNQKAEHHFGIYALYVMFYPQLVAGPIERPQNILHQFYEKKYFDYDRVAAGLRKMLFGYFKKVVIADRLARYVDAVYKDVGHANSISISIAIVFFAFQIYCDFSGYTDIALGSAKVMGYDLMKNFDSPFLSKNVTEFWRRWHISLSSWFNDYLFTPLVIAKRDWGKMGVVFALFITFTISGLWHGAAWTFVIFGMLHGSAVIFEFLTKKQRKKISKYLPDFLYNKISQLLTFIFLCIAWVFFRADSLSKVKDIFSHLFSTRLTFNLTQISAEVGPFNLMVSVAVIFMLYFIRKLYESRYNMAFSIITFLLTIILSTGYGKTFIYFQF